MANCRDAGCNCKLAAGPGIQISGSGTSANPYVVKTDAPGLAESFQVNDTESVNLTLRGSGTPNDPFILQGDATIRLTALADVDDPEGGPAVGEVPTWVGVGGAGHWEFKVPPPSPAGAVNVSTGLIGVGSAPDPIKIRMIGTTAGGATSGLEVYADADGNLRAVAPVAAAVDWSTITGKPSVFPPSTHTHTLNQITDYVTPTWANLSGKPSTFAPSAHTHTLSQITDYTAPTWANLSGKPSTFTPSAHTHTISQITDIANASVSNATQVNGNKVSVQSGAPSGPSTNDLWFWG